MHLSCIFLIFMPARWGEGEHTTYPLDLDALRVSKYVGSSVHAEEEREEEENKNVEVESWRGGPRQKGKTGL